MQINSSSYARLITDMENMQNRLIVYTHSCLGSRYMLMEYYSQLFHTMCSAFKHSKEVSVRRLDPDIKKSTRIYI